MAKRLKGGRDDGLGERVDSSVPAPTAFLVFKKPRVLREMWQARSTFARARTSCQGRNLSIMRGKSNTDPSSTQNVQHCLLFVLSILILATKTKQPAYSEERAYKKAEHNILI
jgi:hypothetical protein